MNVYVTCLFISTYACTQTWVVFAYLIILVRINHNTVKMSTFVDQIYIGISHLKKMWILFFWKKEIFCGNCICYRLCFIQFWKKNYLVYVIFLEICIVSHIFLWKFACFQYFSLESFIVSHNFFLKFVLFPRFFPGNFQDNLHDIFLEILNLLLGGVWIIGLFLE